MGYSKNISVPKIAAYLVEVPDFKHGIAIMQRVLK
jgi:hypothetical protein